MTSKVTIANHDSSKRDIIVNIRDQNAAQAEKIAIAPGEQCDFTLVDEMDLRVLEGPAGEIVVETTAGNVVEVGEAVDAEFDANGIPGLSDAPWTLDDEIASQKGSAMEWTSDQLAELRARRDGGEPLTMTQRGALAIADQTQAEAEAEARGGQSA